MKKLFIMAMATLMVACGGKKSAEGESTESETSTSIEAVACEDEAGVTIYAPLPTTKQELLDNFMDCKVLGLDSNRKMETEELQWYKSIQYNCFELAGNKVALVKCADDYDNIQFFYLQYDPAQKCYIQVTQAMLTEAKWGMADDTFVTLQNGSILDENTDEYLMFLQYDDNNELQEAGEKVTYKNGDPEKKWPSAEVVDELLKLNIIWVDDMEWASLIKIEKPADEI